MPNRTGLYAATTVQAHWLADMEMQLVQTFCTAILADRK